MKNQIEVKKMEALDINRLVENVKHKFKLKTKQQALAQMEYIIENAEPELAVSKALMKKLNKRQKDVENGDFVPLAQLLRA